MAFPTHADYLIIGAGIHGLSTAWRLAERLIANGETVEGRVVVLDKSGIASGASGICLLYTSPSPRDATLSRMPSSA